MFLYFVFTFVYLNQSQAYLTPGPSGKTSSSQNANQSGQRPAQYNSNQGHTKPDRPARYNSENTKYGHSTVNNPERDPGNPDNVNKIGGQNWFENENENKNKNNYLTPQNIQKKTDEHKKIKINEINDYIQKQKDLLNIEPHVPKDNLTVEQQNQLAKFNMVQAVLKSELLSLSSLNLLAPTLQDNKISEQDLAQIFITNATIQNDILSGRIGADLSEVGKYYGKQDAVVYPDLRRFSKIFDSNILSDPNILYDYLKEQSIANTLTVLNALSEEKNPTYDPSDVQALSDLSSFTGGFSVTIAALSQATTKSDFDKAKNLAKVSLLTLDSLLKNPNNNLRPSEIDDFNMMANSLKSILSDDPNPVRLTFESKKDISYAEEGDESQKLIYFYLPKDPTGEFGHNRKIKFEVHQFDKETYKMKVKEKFELWPEELDPDDIEFKKAFKLPGSGYEAPETTDREVGDDGEDDIDEGDEGDDTSNLDQTHNDNGDSETSNDSDDNRSAPVSSENTSDQNSNFHSNDSSDSDSDSNASSSYSSSYDSSYSYGSSYGGGGYSNSGSDSNSGNSSDSSSTSSGD